MSSLLNRKAVKVYTLDQAKNNRSHEFSRVSKEFLERVEANLKVMISREISQLPSVGKTIK